MFKVIGNPPPGVIAFEAVGTVTEDDYKDWMPVIREAIATHGSIRLLARFGPDYVQTTRRGILLDAMSTDAFSHAITRFAMLTDSDLIRITFDKVTPLPKDCRRVFPSTALDEAWTWLLE